MDAIADFNTAALGEVVELPANLLRGVTSFDGLRPRLSDVNGSAVLDLGGSASVTFQGVASARLAADDFVLFEEGRPGRAGRARPTARRTASGRVTASEPRRRLAGRRRSRGAPCGRSSRRGE